MKNNSQINMTQSIGLLNVKSVYNNIITKQIK